MWAGCRWLATPGFRTASSCTVGGHAGAVLPNPCTPPGLPEAICLKLCGHGSVVQHGVVTFLGFSRWDIPDGREEPAVVEPVHPFERGIFNGLKGSPRTSPVDYLGLVKAVDRLGQGVVVAEIGRGPCRERVGQDV